MENRYSITPFCFFRASPFPARPIDLNYFQVFPLGSHNNFTIRFASSVRGTIKSVEINPSIIPKTAERNQVPARQLIIVISSDVSIIARLPIVRLESAIVRD